MKILVIGGGPGGYVAAIRAAQLGADVTLVEKGAMGGTCLNVGCIPTKALLHSAELFQQAKDGEKFGVVSNPTLDFDKVQKSRQSAVNQLVGGVTGLMKANKITVIAGEATFLSKTEVEVTTDKGKRTVTADRIIVATGSVPAIPPIPGAELAACVDSTAALELPVVPKSMVIIGGGVIGIEMASIYNAFGCKTTIVEMQSEILVNMDRELTIMLRQDLERSGIQIMTDTKVNEITKDGAGAVVHVEVNGKKEKITGEKILIAVGRKPETATLNLDKAGIKSERGAITVNDRLQTSVPSIYAIGDCTGGIMLAHVSSTHGEIAAEHIMGQNVRYDGATVPSCIYTTPEFAGVGLTEEQAKADKVDYIVGSFPLVANGKSIIVGESGVIKILAGKEYGEILGMHILGPRATDLITEGALAIGSESTLDEIIGTIHAHPTVGEAVREAALAVEKRAIHIPNR